MFPLNITNLAHHQIFETIEALRDRWVESNGKGAIRLELISRLRAWRNDPIVNAFVSDLMEAGLWQDVKCVATADAVCRFQNGLILGCFSVPYNLDMKLECILYQAVDRPHFLQTSLGGSASGITLSRATAGLNNHRFVAMFMEDFAGVDPAHFGHDRAYFFLDRFVHRFQTKTLPLLARFCDESCFAKIRHLDDKLLLEYAFAWTFLHERAHRRGPLPLPKALPNKNTRSAAGLEELRADLNVLSAAQTDVIGPQHQDRFFLFVLAERLIRYGFDSPAAEDFDARSSNILFRQLRDKNATRTTQGRLIFDLADVKSATSDILKSLNLFEHRVASSESDCRRRLLADYARSFLEISPAGDVQCMDYFKQRSNSQ